MSEIKGQLLGIILVVMIFAAVGGIMMTTFRSLGNTVSNEVTSAVTSFQTKLLQL